jgi:hypothetical protein
LREVVLGRATWRDLVAAGMDIRGIPNGWEFGPTACAPIDVSELDLRAGITRQLETEDQGRSWASFVLAASDLFDLEAVSGQGADSSETLLEALWDISEGDFATARQRLQPR